MLIADYIAIGVLIILILWAGARLFVRSKALSPRSKTPIAALCVFSVRGAVFLHFLGHQQFGGLFLFSSGTSAVSEAPLPCG
jgi:NADH:ubiquinone oxidoreductase subunit 3 (subunit A)